MKKLVFTSSTQAFAASTELNSGPTTSKVLFTGKIHDRNLRSKLVAENIPIEVINDILNNAYKNKDKNYNIQVTVTEANVTTAPSLENNFGDIKRTCMSYGQLPFYCLS